MGRSSIKIDWKDFDKLCVMQCTLEEIASWFNCSDDTIQRACKREKKLNFAVYYAQKACGGRVSLRRSMWSMALAGDKTMCIWLSKQYLGFSEKVAQKIEQQSHITVNDSDRIESLGLLAKEKDAWKD